MNYRTSPNPVVMVLTALFIAPITLPAFLYAERIAGWLWGYVRGFSDTAELVDGAPPRFRFSVLALLGAVAVTAMVFAAVRMYVTRPASPAESRYQTRTNIHFIKHALEEYRRLHGNYPYSADGPDVALYELHDVLEASTFDAAPRKQNPAYWDHDARTLRNGDFIYLNDPRADPQQVLLVTKQLSSNSATYAAPEGRSDWFAVPGGAPSRLLGSWSESQEHGLFVDAVVLADYRRTHPTTLASSTWSSREDGEGPATIDVTYTNGPSFQFIADPWGRLRECTIHTPEPIHETFLLDDLGRIREIQREPASWATIWQQGTTTSQAGSGSIPPIE